MINTIRQFLAWRQANKQRQQAFRGLLSLELADATKEKCCVAAMMANIPDSDKGALARQLLTRACRNRRPGALTIHDAVALVEKEYK